RRRGRRVLVSRRAPTPDPRTQTSDSPVRRRVRTPGESPSLPAAAVGEALLKGNRPPTLAEPWPIFDRTLRVLQPEPPGRLLRETNRRAHGRAHWCAGRRLGNRRG